MSGTVTFLSVLGSAAAAHYSRGLQVGRGVDPSIQKPTGAAAATTTGNIPQSLATDPGEPTKFPVPNLVARPLDDGDRTATSVKINPFSCLDPTVCIGQNLSTINPSAPPAPLPVLAKATSDDALFQSSAFSYGNQAPAEIIKVAASGQTPSQAVVIEAQRYQQAVVLADAALDVLKQRNVSSVTAQAIATSQDAATPISTSFIAQTTTGLGTVATKQTSQMQTISIAIADRRNNPVSGCANYMNVPPASYNPTLPFPYTTDTDPLVQLCCVIEKEYSDTFPTTRQKLSDGSNSASQLIIGNSTKHKGDIEIVITNESAAYAAATSANRSQISSLTPPLAPIVGPVSIIANTSNALTDISSSYSGAQTQYLAQHQATRAPLVKGIYALDKANTDMADESARLSETTNNKTSNLITNSISIVFGVLIITLSCIKSGKGAKGLSDEIYKAADLKEDVALSEHDINPTTDSKRNLEEARKTRRDLFTLLAQPQAAQTKACACPSKCACC
jgi:hypothetical protein